jgi:hypothetical protein
VSQNTAKMTNSSKSSLIEARFLDIIIMTFGVLGTSFQ